KSTLKKKGVDVVITDTSVDSDFGAGNGFERLDGGSKSDVDSGTNGTDRQHDVDSLSSIATRLGTPVMLYSCTVTTCMESWGRIHYARDLVDIRVDRSLKDTMVISIPNTIENGVTMHTKEGEADSPKGNIVFSPKTKRRYFDRDDMEFDDMEHVVEDAEHGNASSENG
nr:hypothetical protein [Tanacetum cinerariifolium]